MSTRVGLNLFFSMLSGVMSGADSSTLSIPRGVLVRGGLDSAFVARFAIFLALLLVWTIVWGKLLYRLCNIPVIAGQIIGGILLGPSLVDVCSIPFFMQPLQLTDGVSGALYALASSDLFLFFVLLLSAGITVSYLLWIAGHETDIQDILKVGVTATTAGMFGAIIPILLTWLVAAYLLGGTFSVIQAIGMGIIFSATSVSIPVAMLVSQKKMHLRSSKATLGAAIIDDIVAVVLLSGFVMSMQTGIFGPVSSTLTAVHTASLTGALGAMIFSFLALFGAGYFVIPPIMRWLSKRTRLHLITPCAHGFMFLYFAFAELCGGLAGITGAYFAGFFHRLSDTKHQAEKVISPYVGAVLLPLFLGSIGLQINIRLLSLAQWAIVLMLLFVAIVAKLLACYAATLLSNLMCRHARDRWSGLETYIFGSSMVARGEVGLVVASILHGSSVITTPQYIMGVVIIILTTIASPIMLSLGFNRMEHEEPESTIDPSLITVGFFERVGTEQMFSLIMGSIEAHNLAKTSITFSEGRKIVNLEGVGVKLILSPGQGIVFEGNRAMIEKIVTMVQKDILRDVERLALPGNKHL